MANFVEKNAFHLKILKACSNVKKAEDSNSKFQAIIHYYIHSYE